MDLKDKQINSRKNKAYQRHQTLKQTMHQTTAQITAATQKILFNNQLDNKTTIKPIRPDYFKQQIHAEQIKTGIKKNKKHSRHIKCVTD